MNKISNPIVRAVWLSGGVNKLAQALGVTPAAVSQWVSGIRMVPAERAAMVERQTGGEVTADALCPHVAWVRVADPDWPTAAGRPCLDLLAEAPQAQAPFKRKR
jgi:DNA-binding transcriptional regulator YdaS (Cro superfamily)